MRSDLKERKERMAPSFQWWANESHRGTLVVVKMENLNWSMVELEGPTEDNFLITTDSLGSGRTRDKGHRGRKNAKQLTWVLMLKAHRVAGCLTSIASALFGLATLIHRHLALAESISTKSKTRTSTRMTLWWREWGERKRTRQ